MISNNTKLKELPKDIKFATYNSGNEDIIVGEYLLALLIYNGQSLSDILEKTNEIENKKERKNVKQIIKDIVFNFINLNPAFAEILKQNRKQQINDQIEL
ncbi:hypothetical protein [Flavobacterium daemonense]|uniref:hypothetical protein n=1 Tax=Flavobacterium daemonense TaxID=1393049 RepID=UPI0011848309|nr:hypothetical protein [Flavobacterium daemonense]KAF2335645.1 hypothetical protein FND99_05650 [Flavobacterium daemonense]